VCFHRRLFCERCVLTICVRSHFTFRCRRESPCPLAVDPIVDDRAVVVDDPVGEV